MSCDKLKHRKKVGIFTLIELLITICIITVLAAMFLPSLAKAKRLASQISCTNNMKQIHLGILNYTEAYQGWMPLSWQSSVPDSKSGYSMTWLQLIYPYLSGKDFDGSVYNMSASVSCPANTSEIYTYTAGKPLTNYMYTAYLGHMSYLASISYRPRKLGKCDKPSLRPIMIDGKCETRNSLIYDFNDLPSASNYVDLRHNGKTNVLFADGHVGQDKVLNMTSSQISTKYKWVYYWSL